MREDDDGRGALPVWRLTQRVRGAIDDWPGSVVAVDEAAGTFQVIWSDGMYPITYPVDTAMVRASFPWEP